MKIRFFLQVEILIKHSSLYDSFFFLPKQLEQSLKGEEVVSKEIMAMSQEEIENELKEVLKHGVYIIGAVFKWLSKNRNQKPLQSQPQSQANYHFQLTKK